MSSVAVELYLERILTCMLVRFRYDKYAHLYNVQVYQEL